MKYSVLLLVLLSSVSANKIAKRYQVNLDSRPEERWPPVIKEFDVPKLRLLLQDIVRTYLPDTFLPVLNVLIDPLEKFIPEPYADEIRGIAQTVGLGVGEILALNILYDLTAFCTSIVAENEDGQIWHGRNLDYNFKEELLNMTIVVDFMQQGQVKYSTTTFLGQVGAFTGMRPYAFSASMNERDEGSFEDNLFALGEALLLRRGSLTSFVMRNVLAKASNYSEAVELFSKTELVAPIYIIVGGTRPREGVIITRDQRHADVWSLGSSTNRWFLLETNYDHWTTPPAHDDRRDPGIKAMEKVGAKNIDKKTLFEVLSVKPVFNGDTVYTTIMSAAYPDELETVIRTTD